MYTRSSGTEPDVQRHTQTHTLHTGGEGGKVTLTTIVSLNIEKKRTNSHEKKNHDWKHDNDISVFFCPVASLEHNGEGFVANYVPVLMTIQHRGHRPSYYFAVFAKMAVGSFFFLFSFEKVYKYTHASLVSLR